MTRLHLCGIALLTASLACKGDPGKTGARGETGIEGPSAGPSISAIVPGLAFLGRSHQLVISGFNTDWAAVDATDVSFGSDVTVDNIVVASPTALVVTITVAESATIGPRDVTVFDGANTQTYAGGFVVDSPLVVIATDGTPYQGSLFKLTLFNRDVDHPFNPLSYHEGDLLYLDAIIEDGINLIPRTSEATSLVLNLSADVFATAGPRDIRVINDGPHRRTEYLLPNAFEVLARTPSPLTAAVPTTATLTGPADSLLYVFAPSGAPNIATFSATSDGTWDVFPTFVLLPANGRFDDAPYSGLEYGTGSTVFQHVFENDDPLYIVALDVHRRHGYAHTMRVDMPYSTLGDRATCADAAQQTLPFDIHGLVLRDLGDQNWFALTTGPDDDDKQLRLKTTGANTVLRVYEDECPASVPGTPWAESNDAYAADALLAPGLTADTTYYVQVSHSASGSAGNAYQLEGSLEEAEPATGNDCANAVAVTLPHTTSTPLLLSGASDEDWFSFVMPLPNDGEHVKVATSAGDIDLDTRIEFFADCGVSLRSVDKSDHESLVSPPLSGEGTYHFRISQGATYGDRGLALYELDARLYAPVTDDEPNDSCDTAQSLTIPFESEVPFHLPSDADEDWFVMTLDDSLSGGLINIRTDKDGPNDIDTAFELYHGATCAALGYVASQDNSSSDFPPYVESWLNSTPLTAGTYFLRIYAGSEFNNLTGRDYYLAVTY